MPSTAHEEYVSEQGTWIGVYVEVLRQKPIGDDACLILKADIVPRSVDVVRQGALI